MKFKAEITLEYDDLFFKAIQPELGDINTERSNLEVKQDEDNLLLKVQSKDAVAFRAIMSSITRLLTINEKIK